MTDYTRFNLGKVLILGKEKDDMNQLLKREFSDPVYGRRFLEEQFSQFITYVISGLDDGIIDASAISRGFESDITQHLSEKKAKLLTRKLRAYATELRATQTGNTWKLRFNIRTTSGAVENWKLEGTVTPLQVSSLLRRVMESPGTSPEIIKIR